MVRRLRIVSGLVLFAFVASHLLNTAMGLHSIALMDDARAVLLAPWSNPVGMPLLAAALAVHLALGLKAIYERNTWHMSASDAVQLAASLAVVPLLIPHVVGTAVAARFGIAPTYASLIPYFWIHEPVEGLRQVLLLTVAWIHGCVGVYTWARIQGWWARVDVYLYPLAVAIPVLALVGFVEAGNQALDRWNNPPPAMADSAGPAAAAPAEPATDGALAPGAPPADAAPALSFDEMLAILKRTNWTLFYIYFALVGATLLARQVRLLGAADRVRVAFVDGSSVDGLSVDGLSVDGHMVDGHMVEERAGLSLLEIARVHDTPVAQLCRGRGRCGTCRVRILETSVDLPPPDADERQTLDRVGADPDMRLSCQLRPRAGFLKVERVLPPYVGPRDLHGARGGSPAPGADAPPEAEVEEARPA